MFIPEDRYVKVGTVNTRYWVEGTGPTLVLVHGMGGSAAGWLPCMAELAAHYQVYAMDLVGHGFTDKPDPGLRVFPNLVEFVVDFMEVMKISRAHVMGHSMGGMVALRLAIEYPQRVDKLIAADAAGLGREAALTFRMASIPGLGELLMSRDYTPDVWKFGEKVRAGSQNPEFITDELIAALHHYEQTPTLYKSTLKMVRTGANWMGQKKSFYEPIVAGLPKIKSPTLVIWGRQDALLPLKQGEMAARLIPNAKLSVIENCGHVPMFDQRDEFTRLVLDFLNE